MRGTTWEPLPLQLLGLVGIRTFWYWRIRGDDSVEIGSILALVLFMIVPWHQYMSVIRFSTLWRDWMFTATQSYPLFTIFVFSLGQPEGEEGGWGLLPYMSYIGTWGQKGIFFSRFDHKKGIDLAILVLNRVWFWYSGLELGIFF